MKSERTVSESLRSAIITVTSPESVDKGVLVVERWSSWQQRKWQRHIQRGDFPDTNFLGRWLVSKSEVIYSKNSYIMNTIQSKNLWIRYTY